MGQLLVGVMCDTLVVENARLETGSKVGSEPVPNDSASAGNMLYILANKRCKNFGTCVDGKTGQSKVNAELDTHAEALGLDPAEQLREFTAAITAVKQADTACVTKEELISRLLGVASGARTRMDEDVSPTRFVAAREALHTLQEALKEFYMEACIPY